MKEALSPPLLLPDIASSTGRIVHCAKDTEIIMSNPLILVIGAMQGANIDDCMFAFDAARWMKAGLARGVPRENIKLYGKVWFTYLSYHLCSHMAGCSTSGLFHVGCVTK
jgi:hypothetical protein